MKKLLLLFIPLALVLAGCSAFQKVEAIATDLAEVSAELSKVAGALAEADTNKDGQTSRDELVAWIAAGGGGVLLGLFEFLRRKISSAKGQLWPEVTALKEKVLTIEAKADKPS